MITIGLKIFGQFSWFPTQVSLSLPFLTLVFSVPGARCSAAAPRYSPTKTHMHFESLVKKSLCRWPGRRPGSPDWSRLKLLWAGTGWCVYRQDITWAAPSRGHQDRHNDHNNLITSPTFCKEKKTFVRIYLSKCFQVLTLSAFLFFFPQKHRKSNIF